MQKPTKNVGFHGINVAPFETQQLFYFILTTELSCFLEKLVITL
jgi:hypothetical protein